MIDADTGWHDSAHQLPPLEPADMAAHGGAADGQPGGDVALLRALVDGERPEDSVFGRRYASRGVRSHQATRRANTPMNAAVAHHTGNRGQGVV